MRPRTKLLLDMTINPGNSGGPLIDEQSGLLIGIVNERIVTGDAVPVGIGVAVPVDLVKEHIRAARDFTELDFHRLAGSATPR